MPLANLSIDLTAKIASFEQELKRATKIAEDNSNRIGLAFGVIKAGVAGLASGVTLGAITNLVRSTADYNDEMGKLAQRAGVSTEAISALNYAAGLADVDAQELAKGLRKLGEDAANGGEKLKKLGIDVRDASGQLKSADQLFAEVADTLAILPDGVQKTSLAVGIFGDKVGPQLIPLLNGASKGLADATKEAEKFGRIVNEEAAKAAEKFNDNLTRLEQRAQGLARTLADPLIVRINALWDAIDRGMQRMDLAGLAKDVIKLNNDLQALEARRGVPFINQQTLERNIEETKAKLEKAKQVFRAADREFSGPGVAGSVGSGDTALRRAQDLERRRNALPLTLEDPKKDRAAEEERRRLEREAEEARKRDFEVVRLRNQQVEEAARLEAAYAAARDSQLFDEAWERDQAALRTTEEQIRVSREMLEQIQFETELLGMNAEQRAIATAERELETQGIVKGTKAYEAYIEKIREAVRSREQKSGTADLEKSLAASIEEGILTGFRNGQKWTDVFKRELEAQFAKIVLRPVIEPIAKAGSEILGSLIKTVFSKLLSFDGGGDTGHGSRSGGLDGKGGFLAMLHPQETVVDHTRGGRTSSGGARLVYAPQFNFNGPADRAQVLAAAQLGAAMGRAQIRDDFERGKF